MTAPPMLTSTLLADASGIRHGFFTREGGVSRGLYRSLNTGPGSRDEPGDVAENRRRAAAAFGLTAEALCTCDQIHSADIVVVETHFGAPRPRADGVVAGRAGLLCGVLAADCAPVLIADAEARVVAAAHAGWRGALDGVIEAAVLAMTGLGADRARLVAAVGPCIGPLSYEVGLEFVERFEAHSAESTRFFSPGDSPDRRLFDLPGFVLWRLAEAGVTRAEWIGEDTFTQKEAFFSNRRAFKQAQPDYGRMLSAIMLEV